jgi:hypothetical protein
LCWSLETSTSLSATQRKPTSSRATAVGRHLSRFLGGKTVEELVEAVPTFPGVADDGPVLAFLAPFEGPTDDGSLR